jgi:hypothetical protein
VTDFKDPDHQKSQAKLPLPMPCSHSGRRGTALLILELGNGWRWEVIFTPWLLYLLQIEREVPIEQEAGWALEPVSTLWKKRKLSCNCQELMNSLISSTGHSPVILTKLSHFTEHYTNTKIHWLPHKEIHFHRGTFSPGHIHTLIYTESTVATVMLPPIFH